MNYHIKFLIIGFIVPMQAMYYHLTSEPVRGLQKLLQFDRTRNCTIANRTAYSEWLKRQSLKERAVENKEIYTLLVALGFSALPSRTFDVDRRMQEILSKSFFCDQIYKEQQAREIVRALARDVAMAGEILKGAIANKKVAVPVIASDSLIFSPLSTLVSVLVSYVVNNIPDINLTDLNRVQSIIGQLLTQADKTEPLAKELRSQAVNDLTNYIKQTGSLLYADEYSKGINRVPTREEYDYAMQLLSQNKPLLIPKKPSAAIEAWRIRASDFLKSRDYQPERYADPEIAHLVNAMVQDINSATAIIKAYLQKKATQATIRKPSLVDPQVHDRVKEIIKAILLPGNLTEEQKTDAVAVLTDQKNKIEQLPPEYQDILKQYFNIEERIAGLSPTPVSSSLAPTPATKTEEIVKEQAATSTPIAPVATETSPSATSAEQKPSEAPAVVAPEATPAAEQPTTELKPISLDKTAASSAATSATPTTEQPLAPVSLEESKKAGGPAVLTPSDTTSSSLRAALETQGQVQSITLGKASGAVPAPSTPSTEAQTTTPSASAMRSSESTPSTSTSITTPSYYETPYYETPSASPAASSVIETESTVPEPAAAPPPVETPSVPSTPSTPTISTPSAPSTPSTPSTPSPVISGPSGTQVQDSLKQLQEQLRQIDTRA